MSRTPTERYHCEWTLFSNPQIQAQPLSVEGDVGLTSPGSRLGWFPRLSQRCARPFVGRGQPHPLWLADRWDAQHEQLQPRTYDNPRDILARECAYDMRMAIYHIMLPS